jgi:lysophospholipase L1-like esterase
VRDRLMGLARMATALRFPIPLEGMPEPVRALVLAPPGIAATAPDRPDAPAAARERARLSALLRTSCAAAGHAFADAAEAIPVPGPDGVHFGPDENAALGRLAADAIARSLDLQRGP